MDIRTPGAADASLHLSFRATRGREIRVSHLSTSAARVRTKHGSWPRPLLMQAAVCGVGRLQA